MYTVKVEGKSLINTVTEIIYQNSDLTNFHILIPKLYDGIDVSETSVIMTYILPVAKDSISVILKLNNKEYKQCANCSWLEYVIQPSDSSLFSSQSGDVVFRLSINDKKIENGLLHITPIATEFPSNNSPMMMSRMPVSTDISAKTDITLSYKNYDDYDNYIYCNDGRYPIYNEYEDDYDISIIDDQKNINFEKSQLNIAQEQNSQYITFRINRFNDGVDILDKKIEIHYINPNDNGDVATPINVRYNNSFIIFGWLVSANVTQVAGKIKFWIQVDGYNQNGDAYTWKTDVCENLNVIPSLNATGEIQEPEPDWYNNVVRTMNHNIQEANAVFANVDDFLEGANKSITNTIDTANASINKTINDANNSIDNLIVDTNTKINKAIDDTNASIVSANKATELATKAAGSIQVAVDAANAAKVSETAAKEAASSIYNIQYAPHLSMLYEAIILENPTLAEL